MKVYYFRTGNGRSPVEDLIHRQDKKTEAKILELIELVRQHGLQLPTNYLKRLSGSQSLWEIRIRSSRQYRILLAKIDENAVVLLHGFIKKTQKTPMNEIQIADERLRQLQATETKEI